MDGVASEDAEALVSPSAAEADMSLGVVSVEATAAASAAQDVALHPTKVNGRDGLTIHAGLLDRTQEMMQTSLTGTGRCVSSVRYFSGLGGGGLDGPEAGIAVVAQPKAYSDWEKGRTSTAFNSISQNAIHDFHLAWSQRVRGRGLVRTA